MAQPVLAPCSNFASWEEVTNHKAQRMLTPAEAASIHGTSHEDGQGVSSGGASKPIAPKPWG